ncbi:MAG: PAS domain S-box protein, partial [Chloroflexi bacterium]|nr:PAS domain S-box protein [Chloroflexota bacterium]
RRFFLKKEKTYQIKKELREMVEFAPQDLIKDPPFSRMDLICCRNLLIYLESDVQKRLLPLLHYALKPGGILFLGPSETVGDATDLFSTLHKKWKIFQRVEGAVSPERLRFPAAFAPSLHELTAEPATDLTARLPALTEKIFLDNYAPTFAVIDEKYRLVYVRGRTGKYLEIASGQPSLSIMDMAREGLRGELTSAIYEATAQKKMVARERVRVKYNGGFQAINLTVAPLTERGMPPGLLMVVFQEAGLTVKEGKAEPASGPRRRVAGVEEELRLTKENLQNTIEELEAANEEMKSANEELQSNNEELQSTNEELDTSREELQSLNEEMATVNSELSAKNELLSTANDDLKNYLNRTDIAIVFLDNELNIRTYTPATADVFNIRDIDIGRPVGEITSRLAYESVVDDVHEVLRTLQSREIEVQRRDGHWYYMRILPYFTVQNALGGVVLSFLDIDKQKQAAARSRLLATVVEDSNDAIITQDMEGRILTWNRGAAQLYGYSEAEALKMNYAQLAPEGERAGSLNLLDDIRHGKETRSLQGRSRTKDGRIIHVWLTISKVVDDQGHIVGLATTARDITQREEEMRALAGRVVGAQEAERRFVAQELHDQIGQMITSLKLSLDQAEGIPVAEWKEALGRTRKLADDLLAQVRNLSLALRPPMLDDLGLLPALIGQFQRYTVQTGIRVDFRDNGIEAPMTSTVTIAAYRIVQEALTNVARHAGVEAVRVDASVTDGRLRLQIEDQGPGFDVGARSVRESMGLTGMRERALALGGWFTIESAPGKGTRVVAELPLTQSASE